MSDFDRNYAATRGVGTGRAVAIDEGLRAYMIRVYNYMAMGVALTGIVSWLTFQAAVVTNASGAVTGLTPFGQTIFGGPAVIVLFLATFGLVLFISFRILRLHNAARSLAHRVVPDDGPDRTAHCHGGQHLPQKHRAGLRDLRGRCADLRRSHGLGHAEDQGNV